MSGLILNTDSDLSTLFKPSIIAFDASFNNITTFSKGISSSYIVATGNTTITSNYPNIIFINSTSALTLTLPTNPSQSGIIIQIRQIIGSSAITVTYPNQIRSGNSLINTTAYMNYSLCTLSDNGSPMLNWWYLFYHP